MRPDSQQTAEESNPIPPKVGHTFFEVILAEEPEVVVEL